MGILPIAIEVAKLAIMAIILWYVCEVLTMPPAPKMACQLLIVFVAVVASVQIAMTAPPIQHRDMSLGYTPNIIAPERR